MSKGKKLPINRLNRFYSQEDFSYEESLGMEYINGDINFTFVLYQVNRSQTDNNDIYGEADESNIIFLPPVEVNGLILLEDSEISKYEGGPKIQETGNLILGVYDTHLKELEVDIRNGDYIGYAYNSDNLMYYSVFNDGRNNIENSKTIGGFKSLYRTISCAPVDMDEFRGE